MFLLYMKKKKVYQVTCEQVCACSNRKLIKFERIILFDDKFELGSCLVSFKYSTQHISFTTLIEPQTRDYYLNRHCGSVFLSKNTNF